MNPQSPFAIANYFIQKAAEAGVPLTSMKLIKLVYIAHGWFLALAGRALLREPVQAWQYGPVIPSLYHAFKQYGNNPIPQSAATTEQIEDNEHADIRRLLDKVWDGYSKFTAAQLSTITHQSDTPWSQVYDEHHRHAVIPDELIRQHYQGKLDASRRRAAATTAAPATAA
jgi:uncharacterized phage-associated protein